MSVFVYKKLQALISVILGMVTAESLKKSFRFYINQIRSLVKNTKIKGYFKMTFETLKCILKLTTLEKLSFS